MADDDQPDAPDEPTEGDAPPPEDVVPSGDDPTEAGWAAPQPTTGPAPAPPPGAVVPRRPRRWLPVFLVIVGLIVVVWIAGGALFATRTLPPYRAADEFLDDLAENRFSAAVSQLCDADADDPDAAVSSVTRHFAGHDSIAVNPFGVDRDGDRATVDYTLSSDDDGTDDETFDLRVVQEDGDWKPCPNARAR